MTKLYRQISSVMEYWEVWCDKHDLVIHFGVVGQTGVSERHRLTSSEKYEDLAQQLALQVREKGFSELSDSDFTDITLRIQTGDEDIMKLLVQRHRLEELLDNALGWTGNGECLGGDMDRNHMNIYCSAVEVDIAFDLALRLLIHEGVTEENIRLSIG